MAIRPSPSPSFDPFSRDEWITNTAEYIREKIHRANQVYSDHDLAVHNIALEKIEKSLSRALALSIDLRGRSIPGFSRELTSQGDRAGAEEKLVDHLYGKITEAVVTSRAIQSQMKAHRSISKPDGYLAARTAVCQAHSVFPLADGAKGSAAISRLAQEVLDHKILKGFALPFPEKGTIENWVKALREKA